MTKAKVKFLILGLICHAREKSCVLGNEAMPEILQLKAIAEDLACFWGHEDLESLFADSLDYILK